MELIQVVFLLLVIAIGLRTSSIVNHASRISSAEIQQLLSGENASSAQTKKQSSRVILVVALLAGYSWLFSRMSEGRYLLASALMGVSVIGWFVEDRKFKYLQEYKLTGDNRIVIERLYSIVQLLMLLAALLFLAH